MTVLLPWCGTVISYDYLWYYTVILLWCCFTLTMPWYSRYEILIFSDTPGQVGAFSVSCSFYLSKDFLINNDKSIVHECWEWMRDTHMQRGGNMASHIEWVIMCKSGWCWAIWLEEEFRGSLRVCNYEKSTNEILMQNGK